MVKKPFIVTESIMAESLGHVLILDRHGRKNLREEIATQQPNLLEATTALCTLGVREEKIDSVAFILLVLFELFQKRSGLEIPLITDEMIDFEKGTIAAMLNLTDLEGTRPCMELLGQTMADHPQKAVLSFVAGHLREHGFGNASKENEQCVRAAKVIMDCFLSASGSARKRDIHYIPNPM